VGVLASDGAEDAEGRGDGVAAAFDGQLDDVLGVEVERVRGEGSGRRVFDPLVNRQNREVPSVGEPPGVVEASEVVEDALVAVAGDEDAVDVVGARQVQGLLREPMALILQK
jgi:hypothetical protein